MTRAIDGTTAPRAPVGRRRRTGTSYSVRLALSLKGVADRVGHDPRTGTQRAGRFRALDAQGLVPALDLGDGTVLTQGPSIPPNASLWS